MTDHIVVIISTERYLRSILITAEIPSGRKTIRQRKGNENEMQRTNIPITPKCSDFNGNRRRGRW